MKLTLAMAKAFVLRAAKDCGVGPVEIESARWLGQLSKPFSGDYKFRCAEVKINGGITKLVTLKTNGGASVA